MIPSFDLNAFSPVPMYVPLEVGDYCLVDDVRSSVIYVYLCSFIHFFSVIFSKEDHCVG